MACSRYFSWPSPCWSLFDELQFLGDEARDPRTKSTHAAKVGINDM